MQLLTFILALALTTAVARAEPVKICEDAGGWPPFIYASDKGAAIGVSVDIADRIFSRLGRKYDIHLLPWKRCLAAVLQGTQYTMILNASYNPERAENYLFSDAYYYIHPYYFYSLEHRAERPPIQNASDLKNYAMGGILGYNYSYYGLEESDIDNGGIYNLEALIHRLKSGQFDFFVENLEVVAGHFLVKGNPEGLRTLGYHPIPGLEPTPFYMLFSKTDQGRELQQAVNRVLSELQAEGELERILKRQLPFHPANAH